MIESMLSKPSGSEAWVMSDHAEPLLGRWLDLSPAGRSHPAVRWAALWAAMVDELIPLVASGRLRAICYEQLADELMSTTISIAADWLAGFGPSVGCEEAVRAVTRRDAKAPGRRFDADRPATRPLSESEVHAIEPIVRPGLGALASTGIQLTDV
jgi:hypothetical protein